MKIIFSPSKSQNINKKISSDKYLKTSFSDKTKLLKSIMANLPMEEVMSIFSISDKKACQIMEYYLNFNDVIPAIDLFSGTSYKELDREHYDPQQAVYMQNQVIILSAYFGILRPMDMVSPYRLDMTDKIFSNHSAYKNLYHFWQEEVDKYFKKTELILNLASKEYSKMLRSHPKENIINIDFLVNKKGIYKSVSVVSKQERGKMLNYCIKNKILNINFLGTYSSDGFIFCTERSDKNNYVFIKG